MALPPRRACPLCTSDEDYSVLPDGAGEVWIYTCNSPEHAAPYSFEVKMPQRSMAQREGVLAELGVYEDLLACVEPNEGWAEYGIIEHRFLTAHPDTYYRDLLPRYPHSVQGPTTNSVSVRLAQAMSLLRREGALVYRQWKPTGYWAKNSQISWWALPPGPPDDQRQTWADYATDHCFDPNDWELDRWR